MFLSAQLQPQFESEYTALLRRRFLWYAALSAPIVAALAVPVLLVMVGAERASTQSLVILGASRILTVLACGASFVYVWRRPLGRAGLVALAQGLIIFAGLLMMIAVPIVVGRDAVPEGASLAVRHTMPLVAALASVLVVHVTACAFLVLSSKEAIAPLVPLLACYAVVVIGFGEAPLEIRFLLVLLAPVVGVPGVLLAWTRYSRLGERLLGRAARSQLDEMSEELSMARRIQESLFPAPIVDGPLRFDFAYEPMRSIGGDFVFVSRAYDGASLTVLIGDVTGHGIPAALAVNRLVGDLEQATAATASPDPGELLARLNRYLCVALAREATFTTALAISVDVRGHRLRWASAGHPPAMLRRANGLVEALAATTVMLGVVDGDEFDSRSSEVSVGVGDSVVMYTDGASEAIGAGEGEFGLDGVRASVQRAGIASAGELARTVLRDVQSFRAGPTKDDVLVVAVQRVAEAS